MEPSMAHYVVIFLAILSNINPLHGFACNFYNFILYYLLCYAPHRDDTILSFLSIFVFL